jgi:inner membrane transporter RhtA
MPILANGPVGPAELHLRRLPSSSFFVCSALFHYLGPAVAVLLFGKVAPLGVMWLRVATAALTFAIWRRPWRIAITLDRRQRFSLVGLGALLVGMNSLFYLAVARLPLATVGTIEFLGVIVLAAVGARSVRNVAALLSAVGGVAMLTAFATGASVVGWICAFSNCAGFMGYVIVGHRFANLRSGSGASVMTGIDLLGASMIIALAFATPIGLFGAVKAFDRPAWLATGIAVGLLSSVIPYVTDQLAMARLPRSTFALMLALLPACATVIGVVVLGQLPTIIELAGIALVVLGIAIHRPSESDTRCR